MAVQIILPCPRCGDRVYDPVGTTFQGFDGGFLDLRNPEEFLGKFTDSDVTTLELILAYRELSCTSCGYDFYIGDPEAGSRRFKEGRRICSRWRFFVGQTVEACTTVDRPKLYIPKGARLEITAENVHIVNFEDAHNYLDVV